MTDKLVSIHRPTDLTGYYGASKGRLPFDPKRQPTRERPLIISASELATFLRCRVKWNWRHQVRLEPKKPAEALSMGTLVHEVLEAWYGLTPTLRTPKAMIKLAKRACRTASLPLSPDDRELAEAMLIGYASWARLEDKEIGLRECTPEMEFDEPLTESGLIRVRGRIDTVFAPTTLRKTRACKEFKTRSQFRDDNVEMLLQGTTYHWTLRRLFPKDKHYILHYTELRKQKPSPRVTAPLFQSQPVERSDEEIEQWALDAERIALDMLDAAIYPNPMSNCQYDCDFRNACVLRGSRDLLHVLKTEYQRKEDR